MHNLLGSEKPSTLNGDTEVKIFAVPCIPCGNNVILISKELASPDAAGAEIGHLGPAEFPVHAGFRQEHPARNLFHFPPAERRFFLAIGVDAPAGAGFARFPEVQPFGARDPVGRESQYVPPIARPSYCVEQLSARRRRCETRPCEILKLASADILRCFSVGGIDS